MGNVIRYGTVDELVPCAGTCGRDIHPVNVRIPEAPDAVSRWREGYCRQCWDKVQQDRPLTEKEMDTLRGLEAYMARRKARIQKAIHRPEQFRRTPIFPELEVKYSTVREYRETEQTKGKLPTPKRSPYLSATKIEGRARYMKGSDNMWRFQVLDSNGQILAYSDPYTTLRNAKRAAVRLMNRLGVVGHEE